MSSTNVQRITQLGFAAAIAVFSPAASCDGGEREMSGTCPDQEVCSPETEDGLHFVGPIIGEGLFDPGDVKLVATGGTQTISIEVSLDGVRTPFDLAYDATIEGVAATIETRQANRLVVRGGASGSMDHLRITDPIDGTLFDRIAIGSQAVTRIELSRTFIDAMSGIPADNSFLYAPGSVAYIQLRGNPGYAVVDEGMQISGSGVTQIKWDQVQLPDLAPGMHPITVVAAGQTVQLQLPIVAGPDRLEESWGTTVLEVGEPAIICYGAFLGPRYVHVPWSFTADNADVEPSYLEGCVNVTARKAGAVVVHVRGGSLVLDHSRSSVRAVRSRPLANPDPAAEVGTDGERAATVRAWMLESTR